MSKMKYCPKCGGTLEESERFCGHCGFDTSELEQTETTKVVSDNAFQAAQKEFQSENRGLSPKQAPVKSKNTAVIIIASVLAFFLLAGGGVFLWINRSDPKQTDNRKKAMLEAPTYSLNEGSYSSEQTVTINQPAGQEVVVYYTLDGLDPSEQSRLYENPIVINSSVTLKSIAIDKAGNYSEIKTAAYVIDVAEAAKQQQSDPAVTDPKAAENAERALFESNIRGTWVVEEMSGFVIYYTFIDGLCEIGDGGAYSLFDTYTFSIVPGNNGTIGTVYVADHVIDIDCNPMGDNAIYIDGLYATFYSQ